VARATGIDKPVSLRMERAGSVTSDLRPGRERTTFRFRESESIVQGANFAV